VVALTACSDGRDSDPGGGGSASGPTEAGDELTDPIVAEDGSSGLASCAFEFTRETLAEREFAFEGTVEAISEPAAMDAPIEVDFAVARWFHGGEGTTVTLKTYDVSGTSLAGDLGLEAGERILAAGDDAFLWGCGFSMPYTDQDADLFEEAFAG